MTYDQLKSAIIALGSKNYRPTQNGRYEAYRSVHSKTICLGTFDTADEARGAVIDHQFRTVITNIDNYGLNIIEGLLFMNRYIAFPNGVIFNLYGNEMRSSINRDGYKHGLFNGQNIQIHRIIATIFCERKPGKDFVNHIDGDKTNNNSNNLEWVTRSENTRHSFENGLQNNVSGTPIFSREEKQYLRDHCYEHYKDVAVLLGRNPQTVRKYLEKCRKER